MYALVIIILAYIVKSLGVFLSILTLYSYHKLHILKKPPGRLIFTQLIILLILQVNEFVDLILSHTDNHRMDCKATDYISIATNTACSLYEVCIAFEVFIRIKSSPMGQNYNLRSVFYHTISILGAIALTFFAAFDNPSCYYEFKLEGTPKE